jgi:hypothetical protein
MSMVGKLLNFSIARRKRLLSSLRPLLHRLLHRTKKKGQHKTHHFFFNASIASTIMPDTGTENRYRCVPVPSHLLRERCSSGGGGSKLELARMRILLHRASLL